MAHIELGVDENLFPGGSPVSMMFRPETAKPLNELAEALLRGLIRRHRESGS